MTKIINFTKTGSAERAAKAFFRIDEYSRKGILKNFVEKDVRANLVELVAIYDHIYEGRSCFIPEFTPELNGEISLEKSKEFWGEYWTVIFGANGENWGKRLKECKEIPYWTMYKAVEKRAKELKINEVRN